MSIRSVDYNDAAPTPPSVVDDEERSSMTGDRRIGRVGRAYMSIEEVAEHLGISARTESLRLSL